MIAGVRMNSFHLCVIKGHKKILGGWRGSDEKDGVGGGGEVMKKMEWGGGGGRGRCGRRRR